MDILRKFLIYILLPSLISIAVGLALTHKLYPYIALILIIAIISTFIIILNLEWKLRKKLRHFERLRKKSFSVDDNMNFYKGSSPRQEDIGSDRDVIRELHYKLFSQILETKNSQKNSYLSIIAPPQEGKSTLLLRFAKELVDNKEIVLWADAYKFAQENPFDELKLTRKRRNKRIFAIIDNIARLQRYEDFLDNLARHLEVKVTLIGASRIEDWEKVKFEHPLGIEYLFENPGSRPRLPYKLEITKADVESAVKKLLDKGVLKEPKKPLRVPPNFSTLIWALADPEGEENFSQRIFEEADQLSEEEKKAYCYICALDRFGLPMPASLIKRILGKDVNGGFESLTGKGIIRYIDKYSIYISRHEVVAETIFKNLCTQIPDSAPCKFYKNIVQKATLKEERLIVILFQIFLDRDLTLELKDDLEEKYEKTFSKSKSAEMLGLGWGPILGEISCYDLAENAFRKSLGINEKFPEIHYNYAILLGKRKLYAEAKEYYQRGLELKEDYPKAHFNYANLLTEMKKYEDAEKHYKRALELKEDYPEAHNNYAVLLAKLKRFRDAEKHFKRALKLNKEHVRAMVNLGFLYLNKDFWQPEKATYWLRKAWGHRDKLPDKGQMVTKALEALSSEKGEKKEEKSPENEL